MNYANVVDAAKRFVRDLESHDQSEGEVELKKSVEDYFSELQASLESEGAIEKAKLF